MAENHDVIIKFNYKVEDFDYLDQLQENIDETLTHRRIGEYDSYELDEDNNLAIFYMSSHDPELMVRSLTGILQDSPILKGAKIDIEMGKDAQGQPIVKEYQL
ncbi:hypothetical protein LLH06_18325 [Mucilaginibacter daejeonensis]|uniref:hypothetical protein n=1 Tax=Mucilaginibacter daejeonensis TaxID=398049 RepID=UPI001D173778|nr:hypothetical protein [Mucilaginibacter daejeonensis]UEG52907.1 hypothetical protein LLH06_18325 [Mucilaginibacter daejeonensis]